MERAAAEERFEDAARYRNRLFAINHLAERQAAGAGTAGAFDVIGLAVEGDAGDGAGVPAPGRTLVDRYAFHLDNVEGQDLETVVEEFCLEYYGAAPAIPRRDRRAEGGRAAAGARAPALGATRRARPGAHARPRREAAPRRARDVERPTRRSSPLPRTRSGGATAGWSRSRSFARRSTSRACPCGSSASTSRRRRASTRSARSSCSRTRKRSARITGSSPSAAVDGQDDYAAIAEMVSRRFARSRVPATAADWDESFAAVPNLVVVDGGKGQLSAALDAMRALDLPRVAVVSLAKREEEVFVPGIVAARAARPLVGRAPAAAARARRGTSVRARLPPPEARRRGARVAPRRPTGRRAGTPAGAAPPLRIRRRGSSRRRRRSSKACPGSRRRRRAPSTRSCTRRVPRARCGEHLPSRRANRGRHPDRCACAWPRPAAAAATRARPPGSTSAKDPGETSSARSSTRPPRVTRRRSGRSSRSPRRRRLGPTEAAFARSKELRALRRAARAVRAMARCRCRSRRTSTICSASSRSRGAANASAVPIRHEGASWRVELGGPLRIDVSGPPPNSRGKF